MDKSILVTGSAGFIGSRVAALLVKQGHHVVGIDNMNNYYDVSLKQHRLHQLERLSGFDFRQIDLENVDAIQQLFEAFSFESVINLAARAGVRYSMENPRVYMTTNALGSLNLLEEIRKHEISKYMLASTSSLYAGQTMPFTEDLAVNTPISSYAASKKVRRNDGLFPPLFIRHRCFNMSLLHGIWTCGTPRHVYLSIYQMDRSGEANRAVWRRNSVERLHVCRRHRSRHDRGAQASWLRGVQFGRW